MDTTPTPETRPSQPTPHDVARSLRTSFGIEDGVDVDPRHLSAYRAAKLIQEHLPGLSFERAAVAVEDELPELFA